MIRKCLAEWLVKVLSISSWDSAWRSVPFLLLRIGFQCPPFGSAVFLPLLKFHSHLTFPEAFPEPPTPAKKRNMPLISGNSFLPQQTKHSRHISRIASQWWTWRPPFGVCFLGSFILSFIRSASLMRNVFCCYGILKFMPSSGRWNCQCPPASGFP